MEIFLAVLFLNELAIDGQCQAVNKWLVVHEQTGSERIHVV